MFTRIMQKAQDLFKGARFVLYDDVLPTLEVLKKRALVMGLLTNLTKGVDVVLRNLNVEPYLDFSVNPAEVGFDKPDPRFFTAALEHAGVDASETILNVCRTLLIERGYDATLMQDGEAALKELESSGFDLAIVATETGSLSGYQVIAEIRRQQASTQRMTSLYPLAAATPLVTQISCLIASGMIWDIN